MHGEVRRAVATSQDIEGRVEARGGRCKTQGRGGGGGVKGSHRESSESYRESGEVEGGQGVGQKNGKS